MAAGLVIQAEDLELSVVADGEGGQTVPPDPLTSMLGRASMLAPRTLKDAREEVDRRVIIGALIRNDGHVSNSAQELGVSRPTLHDLMRKLSINPDDYRLAKGRD
jgi:two-component system NtrC family response regulator